MQTVLHEVLLSLVKLVCPILPHTADEVWSYIGGTEAESVQLTDMPEVKSFANADELKDKFTNFLRLRDEVMKAIEDARNEKIIGKSLESKITIYPSKEAEEAFQAMKDDLRLLFIVSNLDIKSASEEAPAEAKAYGDLKIKVEKAPGETCSRCWVIKEDIGANPTHPEACKRCGDIVDGL